MIIGKWPRHHERAQVRLLKKATGRRDTVTWRTHVGFVAARRGTHTRTAFASAYTSPSYTVMCTPYVTTPNNLQAARSIENTYPWTLPDDDDASRKVSGSCPSTRSELPGAAYTSYNSARHRAPPITSTNAPLVPSSAALASARQRSSVSARAIVRAAGDPRASAGAKAMYGGASVPVPEAGMSHASG
jgi:hypothetical protein